MATKGNLELRLDKNTLQASTTHDGYRVYEAIPRLVEFLDSTRNPTKEQLEEWFKDTSRELLPYKYREELLDGIPDEVIIDVPRKLILHTGHDDYEIVSESFPAKFENASIILKAKYHFEILNYLRPEIRERSKSFGSE